MMPHNCFRFAARRPAPERIVYSAQGRTGPSDRPGHFSLWAAHFPSNNHGASLMITILMNSNYCFDT